MIALCPDFIITKTQGLWIFTPMADATEWWAANWEDSVANYGVVYTDKQAFEIATAITMAGFSAEVVTQSLPS